MSDLSRISERPFACGSTPSVGERGRLEGGCKSSPCLPGWTEQQSAACSRKGDGQLADPVARSTRDRQDQDPSRADSGEYTTGNC